MKKTDCFTGNSPENPGISTKEPEAYCPVVKASSVNSLMTHIKETECMFITALTDNCSRKENIRRNKQLVSDLNYWELSFIKLIGGYAENGSADETDVNDYSFCVINNRYTTEDFIDIAVTLCKKYGQDAVLVTFPVAEKPRTVRSKQNIIRTDGKYYKKDGTVDMEFNNITIQNVAEYFTRIGNRQFTLYSEGDEVTAEPIDVYGVAGRLISRKNHQQKKKSFNNSLR